jgi:hypothetical protein
VTLPQAIALALDAGVILLVLFCMYLKRERPA